MKRSRFPDGALKARRPALAVLALVCCSLMAIAPVTARQVTGEPATGEQVPQVQRPQEAPVVGEDATGEETDELYGPPAPPVEALPATETGRDPFAAMLTRLGPSAIRFSGRTPQLYKTTEGDETFLFEADGRRGFIRFPCDPGDDTLECALVGDGGAEETMILTSTRSPRGDVTWSDQSGAALLRVTSNGGATLFAPSEASTAADTGSLVPLGGRAVLPVSRSSGSLKPPPMSFDIAATRMQQASDLINDRHGTLVTFMAPGIHSGDQAVLADAVLTAAKGIDSVARDQLGSRIISERLAVVEFVPGRQSGLALKEAALTVTYNPAGGVAGRPSSISVARYLESNL